jgi:YbgC/YbaW family acyl-CoA thioester hydrolase
MIREILRSIVLNKFSKKTQAKPFMSIVTRKFRAGLFDIDFNMHINNANYMRFMEKARWDHPVQTNTWDLMLKQKLNFIVAGIEMGYIREIPFAKQFEVQTHYLGWDEKYVYLEQRFVVADKIYAYGLVKAVFLQKGRLASPETVAEILGIQHSDHVLPQHIELWKQMTSAKREFSTPNVKQQGSQDKSADQKAA